MEFLPIRLRPSCRPTDVVVLPSPAGVGVIAALLLTAFYRTLNWRMLREAMLSAVTTTGMTLLILIAAFYLNFILGVLGVPAQVSAFVSGFDVPPLVMILLIVILYLLLGCFLDALAMMTIRPADFLLRYVLGKLLCEGGRFQKAITALREAIGVRPNSSRAHVDLGVALASCGRHDEALAAYQEAVRLDPEFALAHYGVGRSLVDHGRHDQAIESFRQSIRLIRGEEGEKRRKI